VQSIETFSQWSSRYDNSQPAMSEGVYRLLARERARKIQPWIARQHRVLEYGVGTALNLAAVRCRERWGWDHHEHVRPEAERRGVRWIASMEEIPDASFDVVVCHHVPENVFEPGSRFQTLSRILRPDGTLLLFARRRQSRTLGNLLSASRLQVDSAEFSSYGYERFAAEQVNRWGGERAYSAMLRILRALRPMHEVRLVARKPK